jgi:hypothetical protein
VVFHPKKVEETFVEAKSVTLAPIDPRLSADKIDKGFPKFIRNRLIKQKLTLRKGQDVSVKVLLFGTSIRFRILETDPDDNVKATKETTVKILASPQ